MFKNLSELKSGKECDGLHSLAELIFDGMIVVLLAFTLKHFVFLSPAQEDMIDLLNNGVGCHSKVFFFFWCIECRVAYLQNAT